MSFLVGFMMMVMVVRMLVQVMHMGVQSLDVMVVRLLRFADLVLMAEDRHAILAERTVHVALAVQRFLGSLRERLQQ